jgi:hypothetical protein
LKGIFLMTYVEHIEADIAAFAEFRANPWLTPAEVEILDRKIAQYTATVSELRSRGW